MTFHKIDYKMLKDAIQIYMNEAYPKGIKEKNFYYKNIIAFQQANNREELLALAEHQKITLDESINRHKITFRLGSDQYPYLKLVLQEANQRDDYGFLVDRHTEYLTLLNNPESKGAEKRIIEYTRVLKYKIEDEYEKASIPTFREIVKAETKELVNQIVNNKNSANGINVLLAEDDKDVQSLLKLHLELLGYQVSTADNGEEAVYKIYHETNDLVILDLMMPVMNGFDVIKMAAKKIPIIVLTSLSDVMSCEKCLESGAKAVLTKPVEIEIVNKNIKKVLNKSE